MVRRNTVKYHVSLQGTDCQTIKFNQTGSRLQLGCRMWDERIGVCAFLALIMVLCNTWSHNYSTSNHFTLFFCYVIHKTTWIPQTWRCSGHHWSMHASVILQNVQNRIVLEDTLVGRARLRYNGLIQETFIRNKVFLYWWSCRLACVVIPPPKFYNPSPTALVY